MKHMIKLVIILLCATQLYSAPILIVEEGNNERKNPERQWTPYLGAEKIEESEFFQIAGYEYDSIQAAAHKRKRNTIILSGLCVSVSLIGGSLFMLTKGHSGPLNYAGYVAGFSGLGGTFLYYSIGPVRYAPVTYAAESAEKYNSTLK